MFQLLSPTHLEMLDQLVKRIPQTELSVIANKFAGLIEQVREDIPEKKRTSVGRYSITKKLAAKLDNRLKEAGIDGFDIGEGLFINPDFDPFVRSLGVGLISNCTQKKHDLDKAQSIFEAAAGDDSWIVRECASGLVRLLLKSFPNEMSIWYKKLVKSDDPLLRRFASESLRPVVENRWIHQQPEYALSIIQHLFQEEAPYPRTSVGNNLSDWIRVNQEIAYPIVEELARNGDRNSYWIAYRACRNLVKKKPLLVMDLLGVNEYKYKNKTYYRKDYQENPQDQI
jgi:3-methyladenine DNA glycosylase AlkC